jgi:choline dehydrogenase-like flavoprotein
VLELGRGGRARVQVGANVGSVGWHILAGHHMGTTRMANDPRHGVTDGHGRVHGIANLYLAGSSLFPTTGFASPTLTIVALALRQVDHLIEATRKRS